MNWNGLIKNANQNDSYRFEIKRFDIIENGTAIICGTKYSKIFNKINIPIEQFTC